MTKSVITKAVAKERIDINLINNTVHTINISDVFNVVEKRENGNVLLSDGVHSNQYLLIPESKLTLCSDRMLSAVKERLDKIKAKQDEKDKIAREKEAKLKEKEANKITGRRNYVKNKKFYSIDIKEFSEKLVWLMSEEGVTTDDIKNRLKVGINVVSSWINGNFFPDVENRKVLAEMFGVDESFLTESSGSNKKVRITRSLRGMSDWYFKSIGKEFEFVKDTLSGCLVKVTSEDGLESNMEVRKGDYLVVFKF